MPDLTVAAQVAFAFAGHEAEKLGSSEIDVEHLFLGLCNVVDLSDVGPGQISGLDEKGIQTLRDEVDVFSRAISPSSPPSPRSSRRLAASARPRPR